MMVTVHEDFPGIYFEINLPFLEFQIVLKFKHDQKYKVMSRDCLIKDGFNSISEAEHYCLENNYEVEHLKND
jgi:hypothetical protein